MSVVEPDASTPIQSERYSDRASHSHLAQPSRTGTPWHAILTMFAAVWAVGLIVCFARLFRGLFLVRRLQRTLIEVTDPRLRQAARTAFEAVDLKHNGVFESSHAPTPLTLGLFRPVVVLPAGFSESLDDDELQCVLIHEAAHIKRLDTWIGLLQRIAQSVFWWNPLLLLANRSVNRLREQICDDYVIVSHGDGRPLAKAIVKVAEWSAAGPALPCCSTLVNETEELSERINRLTEKEHVMTLQLNWKTTNVVLLFSLLLSAVLFIPTVKALNAQETEKEAPAIAAETPDAQSKPANESAAGAGLRIIIPAQGPAPLALSVAQPTARKARGWRDHLFRAVSRSALRFGVSGRRKIVHRHAARRHVCFGRPAGIQTARAQQAGRSQHVQRQPNCFRRQALFAQRRILVLHRRLVARS